MFHPGRAWAAAAISVALAVAPLSVSAADEIVLGATVSLTGQDAANGVHIKNGYDFAVARINAAGGVNVNGTAYKLRILYYDDGSDPDRGAKLVEGLITQDGVRYMLGPTAAQTTDAIAPIVEANSVPMISAVGVRRAVFEQGYRHVFGVVPPLDQQLLPATAMAADRATKSGRGATDLRVALIFGNGPVPADEQRAARLAVQDLGMRVVLDETVAPNSSELPAALTRVLTKQPDLLLMSAGHEWAANAARLIGAFGLSTPMIAISNCEAAGLPSVHPSASDGILCPATWASTLDYQDPFFGSAPEFVASFRKAYVEYANDEVPAQAAQAAAAVWVFKDAFERAGATNSVAVRDAIAQTDLQTFYGPIVFGPGGVNTAKPMILRQALAGTYIVIAPAALAEATIPVPRP